MSPEEVAAIAAVTALLEQQRRVVVGDEPPSDELHMWVEASRRSAQRAGMQRGPWRLTGRISRRSRA